MPNLKLELTFKYLTASQARGRLGLSRFQFDVRLKRGIFPSPTFTDVTGVRYFDESWVSIAQAILESPQSPATVEGSSHVQLDPYVARALAAEPVEIQRAFIAILNILKSISKAKAEVTPQMKVEK